MKGMIKAAGVSLAILGASFSFATEAAQKIAYVSTANVLSQMAQNVKLNDKLKAEFKDRVAEIKRAETKLRTSVEKLKRDHDVMSESARTKLQRDIQAQEAAYQLQVQNLREDQAKRGGEEQRKLLEKLQSTVKSIATKNGYDMVVDRNAVIFASPKDDLSDQVLKAMR